MQYRVAYVPSLYGPVTETASLDWESCCELLTNPLPGPYREKNAIPLFVPADIPPGPRKSSLVKSISFAVLDFDNASAAAFQQALDRLNHEKLDYVWHTTYSHTPQCPKLRLCVPFTRLVGPTHWPTVWQALNRFLLSLGDRACSDASRAYFLPYRSNEHFQTGRSPYRNAYHPTLEPVEHGRGNRPDKAPSEKRIRATLQRAATSDRHAGLADAIEALLDGRPFAEQGERDATAFRLCSILRNRWPDTPSGDFEPFFAASLAQMASVSPDDALTWDVVQEKLDRIKTDTEDEQETEETRRRNQTGRSEPYTEEEIAALALRFIKNGATTKTWILENQSEFYFLTDRGYQGPTPRNSASDRALTALSPAPVSLYGRSEKTGKIRITSLNTLMQRHGTSITAVEHSYQVPASQYDQETDTLTIRAAPQRIPSQRARFHQSINDWIEAFTRNEPEDLHIVNTWLSRLPHLDHPLSALLLSGPPGTGKTLLATGCSRLWTENGPIPLEKALSGFNISLKDCPLILADEHIPKDFRGNVRTEELRVLIQERERQITQKFQASRVLRGCTRTIITANNEMVLNGTHSELTAEDWQAVSSRIYHVRMAPESAEFLKQQNIAQWVAENWIAEHVLYLQQNYKSESAGRFYLPESRKTTVRLQAGVGQVSAVLNWIIAGLDAPSMHANVEHKPFYVVPCFTDKQQYRIIVNTKRIYDLWSMHGASDRRAPSTIGLGRVIGGAQPERHGLPARADGRIPIGPNLYREMSIDLITEAFTSSDNGTAEDLEKRMKIFLALNPVKE